jgi:hypothetical protein
MAAVEVTPAGPLMSLEEGAWTARAAAHADRADRLTEGHRARAAAGRAHPVEDFLFTYYSLRPARLRRWHPGAGVALLGGTARSRLSWRWYGEVAAARPSGPAVTGVGLDLAGFRADRADLVGFVHGLLDATSRRTPELRCFGLHEWAMVYREAPGHVRHADRKLRLGPAATDAVVEQHQIRCTHFDAYRFFTADARPRNALPLLRESQPAVEQPGCLHATMDLYKWAVKLGPLVPGELLLDCFELARDVRALDMRASPYDLADLGYPPVRIETPEGKAEYVAAQRRFADRATPLRARLIALCVPVLEAARREVSSR